MQKKTDIKEINIGYKCGESWSKMSLNHLGRHCSKCTKTVIDFTRMTDEEIIGFFEKPGGQSTCGMFSQFQLDKLNARLDTTGSSGLMNMGKSALIATALSLTACNSTKNLVPWEREEPAMEVLKENINPDSLNTILVKGVMRAQSGEPLIYASLSLDDPGSETKIGVDTDFNGEFKLALPANVDNQITLLAQHLGYGGFEIKLADVRNKEIKITLVASDIIGMVVIRRPIHKRIWYRIKSLFIKKHS